MKHDLVELERLLAAAAAELPNVTARKMFGCQALWARGSVFALVWKHGRIGVKLPDERAFAALMSEPGAAPWKAGPMTMAHWVLLPETFHARAAEIRRWAARAHALCSALEPKPKRTAAKKTSARSVAAKPSMKKKAR